MVVHRCWQAMRRQCASIACLSWARALLVVAALPLALAGCGKTSPTIDQLLASGKAAQARGQHKAAIIQFGNVLQKQPTHAEANYLSGFEYLQLGDFQWAEKYFRQADDAGYNKAKIAASLGKALLLMGQYQPALDLSDIEADDPRLEADVLAMRGLALIGLGRSDEASAAFTKALELAPQAPDALIGQAQLALDEGKIDDAVALADRATASAPDNVDAWIFKGQVLRYSNRDGALEAFKRVTELDPENVLVRMNMVSMHMTAGNLEQAESEVDAARKIWPRSVLVKFMEALVDYAKGNYFEAGGAILFVLDVLKDHLPSILLAGAIEYQSGSYTKAEQYLTQVIQRMPDNLFARKLLALSLAQGGNPERGLDVLRPALMRPPEDVALLRLAGDMAIQNNDPTRALEFFERASKVAPKNAAVLTGLGASRFAHGEMERAMADLEAAVKLDSNSVEADYLLAMTYLGQKKFDQALGALKTMEEKQPQNPLTHDLRGVAYIGKKDTASARKALARALELQPTYIPAQLKLAQIEVAEGNGQAARDRLNALLERGGKNEQVLLALAELGPQIGASLREQTEWLERAMQAAPGMARPRLMLAGKYAQNGDLAKAEALLADAQRDDPQNREVIDALASIRLSSGDARRAVDMYGKLVALEPESAMIRYRLANAQARAGDFDDASYSLRKALELNPALIEAMALLVAVEISRNSYADAMETARQVQKRAPKSPLGRALEGDVLMAERKFLGAARSYEAAYAMSKTNALAMKLHAAYESAGRPDLADARLTGWLESAPDDLDARRYSAEVSFVRGKFKEAIDQYEWLQQRLPDDAVVANNLAWSYLQTKDERALSVAERAYRLKPQAPEILDTYGCILVDQGGAAKGIELLQAAVKAAPNVPAFRLHLAQAWLNTGDRDRARDELEVALATGTDFPERNAAVTILESLKKKK